MCSGVCVCVGLIIWEIEIVQNKLSVDTNKCVYKAVLLGTFLYGAET